MVDEDVRAGADGRWRHPREHRDETRGRILAASLQLIAERGFAATSTREISERLGFTKAALYYHFRTKADLLAAIVQPVMEELVALVGSVGAPRTLAERRRVVERYVDVVAAHASLIKVLSDDPSVRRSEVLGAARPQFRRLVEVLAGCEQPDVVERARVRAALGAVHATLVRAEPDEDPAALRDVALSVALAVLGLGGTRSSGTRSPATSSGTQSPATQSPRGRVAAHRRGDASGRPEGPGAGPGS